MAHYEHSRQIAYQQVGQSPEVVQVRNSIPRKPVAHHARNESRTKLSPSPIILEVGETASLDTDDTDAKAELTGTRANSRPKRLCLPSRSSWLTLKHWLATLCIVGLIIASILASQKITGYGLLAETQICDSSGNFRLQPGNSFWSPSRAFEITLSFGRFSFANAKFIDVAWDIVSIFWGPPDVIHQLPRLRKGSHNYHGRILCDVGSVRVHHTAKCHIRFHNCCVD